jgi:gamma-polyglutamate biosynthesis protein CapA
MDRKVHAYIGWGVLFIMAAVLAWLTFPFDDSSKTLDYKNELGAVATATEEVEVPLFSLINTGDVMLGRNVEALQKKYGENYPFAMIQDFLQSASAVMVNLEGPIPLVHHKTVDYSTQFSFRDSEAKTLADNNIKIVTLANNHGYDWGRDGFENTLKVLAREGIAATGHPKKVDRDYVTQMDVNGIRISFVGFNAFDPVFDHAQAVQLIKDLVAEGDAGYIMVNIHWGTEYNEFSNDTQQVLGHDLIDAGADVIIGHHPHVTEEKEVYKGKDIYYSLGNFIFDQYFSSSTQHGLVVKTTWYKNRVEREDYRIESVRSQPAIVK